MSITMTTAFRYGKLVDLYSFAEQLVYPTWLVAFAE
jgi:hypothetical protein